MYIFSAYPSQSARTQHRSHSILSRRSQHDDVTLALHCNDSSSTPARPLQSRPHLTHHPTSLPLGTLTRSVSRFAARRNPCTIRGDAWRRPTCQICGAAIDGGSAAPCETRRCSDSCADSACTSRRKHVRYGAVGGIYINNKKVGLRRTNFF